MLLRPIPAAFRVTNVNGTANFAAVNFFACSPISTTSGTVIPKYPACSINRPAFTPPSVSGASTKYRRAKYSVFSNRNRKLSPSLAGFGRNSQCSIVIHSLVAAARPIDDDKTTATATSAARRLKRIGLCTKPLSRTGSSDETPDSDRQFLLSSASEAVQG